MMASSEHVDNLPFGSCLHSTKYSPFTLNQLSIYMIMFIPAGGIKDKGWILLI